MMNHHALASYAKKHYQNIKVCNLDKLEDRYVFICNSMLASLNKLAIDNESIIIIDELAFDENGMVHRYFRFHRHFILISISSPHMSIYIPVFLANEIFQYNKTPNFID